MLSWLRRYLAFLLPNFLGKPHWKINEHRAFHVKKLYAVSNHLTKQLQDYPSLWCQLGSCFLLHNGSLKMPTVTANFRRETIENIIWFKFCAHIRWCGMISDMIDIFPESLNIFNDMTGHLDHLQVVGPFFGSLILSDPQTWFDTTSHHVTNYDWVYMLYTYTYNIITAFNMMFFHKTYLPLTLFKRFSTLRPGQFSAVAGVAVDEQLLWASALVTSPPGGTRKRASHWLTKMVPESIVIHGVTYMYITLINSLQINGFYCWVSYNYFCGLISPLLVTAKASLCPLWLEIFGAPIGFPSRSWSLEKLFVIWFWTLASTNIVG